MNDFLETRKKFFDFFKERGHSVVPSSSLRPDDPSVLLTSAGMQQFKKYYLGVLDAQADFNSSRITTIQKCFRTTDFEEVGDNTHLTFFEMMGNFSFRPLGNDDPNDTGSYGYFKKASMVWAYEFLTERLGINPERITVTVFEGEGPIPRDEEAFVIWNKEIGIPKERISYGNRSDNFWGPTGPEGPCGPTVELYVDGVEIWNVVFNEYQAYMENGVQQFRKMEFPGIDTGMGFERLLTVIEGKKTIFETSALTPIVDTINAIGPHIEPRDVRILTDHIRGAIFCLADGIEPSNKEAGYMVRRLLRKIIALKNRYDIHEDLFGSVYRVIRDQFKDIYPEISDEKKILGAWEDERARFEESMIKGLKEMATYTEISGHDAFMLYETYGLPFELIQEMAPQSATQKLKKEEFDEAFKKHQEISRAGMEKKFGGHGLVLDTGELKATTSEEMERVIQLHTTTHILQWALRKVLGDDVHQMGSDINPERLRFDFNCEQKLTDQQIQEVEGMVRDVIKKDFPVYYKEMSKEEALRVGALSFFREKYPQVVKVYFIGGEDGENWISAEFCGGPHVGHTGEIKNFKILKQESIGKGLRRIKATVTE